MSDRDLTPDEARAEVEAFMGEGWYVRAWRSDVCVMLAFPSTGHLRIDAGESTFRAAVDALLQAWRDAVRPAAERGVVFGLADLHHSADPAVVQQEYAKRIPFLTSLSLGEEA